MCKKLFCLFTFVLVLAIAASAPAEMVGYWRFDEGSGNVAVDTSGNGNDGTLNGNPQWVAGYYGTALEFDGSDDWLDCGSDASLGLTTWTITFWLKANQNKDYNGFIIKGLDASENYEVLGFADGSFHMPILFDDGTRTWPNTPTGIIVVDEWAHYAYSYDSAEGRKFYKNGELIFEDTQTGTPATSDEPLSIGNERPMTRYVDGTMDDIRIYNNVLTEPEILAAMEGGQGYPYALGPSPKDGTLYADTWTTISWRAGDFAVSHDVYFGENFDDVNDGTEDTFRGNQDLTYFIVGFPGYPYPDGLVPGTTYYWRIDEVNEAEPNSPWKGKIWSFLIPPKTAYYPDPADGAELIDLDVQLNWTAGFGTKLHYIVFGEDYDEVNNAAMGVPNGSAKYTPGPLKLAKTYYWRVDEFDGIETYKGEVWSFTTQGSASGANPANGAVDVKPSAVLYWDAGSVAASHEVYFGSDADAVRNATTASPEYKGTRALGEESYDPGKLEFNTAYYWRIDEVNAASTDSPWTGVVWSFTTGDFFVIDDFEDYDTGDNQIWYAWHDGLGYGAVGTDPYFAGNGTGAAVGDETTASYTEETIVHGGGKAMPVSYDNNKQGFACYSEVEHKLAYQRDWTEGGVGELSIWFRGQSENGVEPLYVAVSNSAGAPALVVHNDPAAAIVDTWTQWIIPLSVFADMGIDLSNVDEIAIGMGTQGNLTAPGGSGKMYFDDIRLCRPKGDAE